MSTEECPICFELFDEGTHKATALHAREKSAEHRHFVCKKCCLQLARDNSGLCPICRKTIRGAFRALRVRLQCNNCGGQHGIAIPQMTREGAIDTRFEVIRCGISCSPNEEAYIPLCTSCAIRKKMHENSCPFCLKNGPWD